MGSPRSWSMQTAAKPSNRILVVFAKTPGKLWSRKIFRNKESRRMPEGIEMAIGIWGM